MLFQLNRKFVDSYRELPEPFGFGLLGALSFYRTYAREIDDGVLESWVDTCARVIDGMYTIQKEHCINNGVFWNEEKAQSSASEAFDRLFNLKWSPPGRGLYAMGTPSVHERKLYESLQNCGFISTHSLRRDGGNVLAWIMSMLMLGVGIGVDLKGADLRLKIVKPQHDMVHQYRIADSREGWAASLAVLFDSYFPELKQDRARIIFDYSEIRKKGEPIRGFGGKASGPEPLQWIHEQVRALLDSKAQSDDPYLDEKTLADIINMIGVVVVSGNVRRSSEILLGHKDSVVFANLKNLNAYPERSPFYWASNNSVYASIGMDYSAYTERIFDNGEPGFVWMSNANQYARMNGVYDLRDRATGVNPCSEQFLVGYSSSGIGGELCTLVETYPNRHDNLYDFLRSLKFAFLYGKSVTLLSDRIVSPGTREIMMDNRRIGVSVTGIAQFIAKHGIDRLQKWLNEGYNAIQHYDRKYSAWFGVNRSVRTTTVKPSGTVSLLAGATPGVHFPFAPYYIRRIRLQENSYLVERLQAAGVHVEPDVYSPDTVVAEIPIFAGENIRSARNTSMYEQLELAAFMQSNWSDNGVSVTVSIDPKRYTPADLASALSLYQYRLKSVSFLPETEEGAFQQMPYEEISKEKFEEISRKIDYSVVSTLRYVNHHKERSAQMDLYCDGDACAIV